MSDRPLILCATERKEDLEALRTALDETDISIHGVTNLDCVARYLKGEQEYANRNEWPSPSILLLSLTLPGGDALELLRWIRSQAKYSTLRVVVITTSTNIRAVNRAYTLGANSFLISPNEFEDTNELAKTFSQFWLLWPRDSISPLRVILAPGSAPPEVIADVLSDISKFYRLDGGSGVTFDQGEIYDILEELA